MFGESFAEKGEYIPSNLVIFGRGTLAQTLTWLGTNTIFSFNGGTRVMNLGGGAMLFQVRSEPPRGIGPHRGS